MPTTPFPYFLTGNTYPCKEVHGSRKTTFNPINGAPNWHFQVEVNVAHAELVANQLLGTPEKLPMPTSLFYASNDTTLVGLRRKSSPRCVAAEINYLGGYQVEESGGSLCDYTEKALINITYVSRPGVYIESDYYASPVYWMDELAPKYESRPLSHRQFIWGDTDPAVVPADKIPLDSDETPVQTEAVSTLTHTIEGWIGDPLALQGLFGTTNYSDYTSPILNTTFPAGTLLLKSATPIRAYSFASHRVASSGVPFHNVICYYEYRPRGWETFWRNDAVNGTEGYYYIRRNQTPYGRYNPFPKAAHNIILNYSALMA